MTKAKRLLIVWHSRTGGTAQMVRAASEAAAAEVGIEIINRRAGTATSGDMLTADGYLFAAPENLASVAGAMKEFFDRVYYDALGRINGRPYALLICAGSDGSGAMRQIQRICTGLRLKEVAPPLIINTQAQTPERIWAPKQIGTDDLARCAEIGGALAAGLAAGIF